MKDVLLSETEFSAMRMNSARLREAVFQQLNSTAGRALMVWLAAAILILVSRPSIQIWQMNDLGLISVLPTGIILAVALVNAGFVYLLTRPELDERILLAYTGMLIFLLTSLMIPAQETPRFAVTWRHAGVVEYIMNQGSINPRIDAYFNWPIFFALSALYTQASGLPTILKVADWAPLLYNLLYLGPLVMALETATQDRRKIWLGVWLFYLLNWIGQDYFSPQGFNFFLYLAVLAILLRWFRLEQPRPGPQWTFERMGRLAPFSRRLAAWLYTPAEPAEPLAPGQRRAVLGLIVLVMGLIVSSHQLTPFALLLGMSALVVFNRIRPRYLPLLLAGMIVVWFSSLANTYLNSRIMQMLASVGNLDQAMSVNVVNRLAGSPGHTLVVRWRLVITVGIWALAGLSMVRRYRKGFADTSLVLLAGAPFVLVGMQPYGGEMLMRVFLFNLPFMVFFIADLGMDLLRPQDSLRRAGLVGLILIGLSAGYFLARYGNERMDQFTAKEVAAMQYVYDTSMPGSLVAAATPHLPTQFHDYQLHPQAFFEEETVSGDIDAIVARMRQRKYPQAYLILTRSQIAHMEMFFSFGRRDVDRFANQLLLSGRFKLVYQNDDARVFMLTR